MAKPKVSCCEAGAASGSAAGAAMLLESSLSICFTLSGNRPHRAPCADVPGSLRSKEQAAYGALSRVMSQQIHRFLYRNRVHVAEQCFDQFQKPKLQRKAFRVFALEIKPADIVRFPRGLRSPAQRSLRCRPEPAGEGSGRRFRNRWPVRRRTAQPFSRWRSRFRSPPWWPQ